jgi:hypothetical protein
MAIGGRAQYRAKRSNRGLSSACTATLLDGRALSGLHSHPLIRVQTEPIHAGASRTGRKIHALGVDLITNSSHTTTGIGTIRCSAGYRGCVKPGQPRLIASKRIRFLRIAVRSQATTIEQPV